jgi:fatty acid desaturase
MTAWAEPELDGATDILLAPVSGPDFRRNLDPALFTKKPAIFSLKVIAALLPLVATSTAVALAPGFATIVVAVVVNGLIYAHLVELQHECLHEHAYRSRRLNRLVGFMLGAPMLSSFWHYKYQHLRHHAFLGTPQNREFFNYRFHNLNTPVGFLAGCYHLGRYRDVAKDLARSCVGRTNPDVTKTIAARKIRTEYQVLTALLLIAAVTSATTANAYLLWVWVVPTLLVAEPAHFLIELPEHYGLNTQSDPNVLANTRTVNASFLGKWFTNRNDVHTAHHFHQGVPMVNVPKLHALIRDRVEAVEPSFPTFYRRVITGDISFQGDDATCMTR